MTKPMPFTAASLARAIRGVELAGRFVIGVKTDGTLIVGDKPVATADFVPAAVQDASASPSKWADQPTTTWEDLKAA
jgi:hypothetical protein